MRTVLLVDDDPAFHELVATLIEPSGLELVRAENVKEATAAVASRRPDLWIVDSLLPDGEGVSWIRDARARGDGTPAVVLSASPAQVTLAGRLARQLGISLVLAKPIMAEVFLEQIAVALADDPSQDARAARREEASSADDDAALADALRELRDEYKASLPRRLEVLSHAVDLVRELDGDPIALAAARGEAHRLRGTAGTYGFQTVGEAAARIEERLLRLPDEGPSGRARLLDEIEYAVAAAQSGIDAPAPRPDATATARPTTWRILAVDDDRDLLEHLHDAGRRAGVEVVGATTAADARTLARTLRFDAALIDVNLAPPDVSWVFALDLRIDQPELPFAFLSADGAVDTRIAAVHAGAALYLQKPLDEASLREAVARLAATAARARTRVLILDDDPDFRARASLVLSAQSMHVRAIGDPAELLEALEAGVPDVLLLDVQLGETSGFDVCRLVRAMPRWRELPILFITASADNAATRTAAFEAGGDDWVQKPLVEPELVARVRSRADRMRARFDARDGLTGLPLRGAGYDALAGRLGECARAESPLTVALLDLDGFKNVNEAHGHAAGDRVLAHFGSVIARRFRPEDVRLRWAGDEFLIGFPALDLETAAGAIARLKEELGATVFKGEGALTLRLSFSAGLASFPRDGRALDALVAKAEERLGLAKRAGGSMIAAR